MIITTEDSILRLVVALVLGALIGYERQTHSKAAGLRTHTLVCIGACLCMIVSIHISMDAFFAYGYRTSDPERIAAQVVSGVGFLGAGTIMANQKARNVQGLTTAAGLWAVAAIGLVVGAGYLVIAVAATLMILLVLAIFVRLDVLLLKQRRSLYTIHITMKNTVGQSRRLVTALQSQGLHVEKFQVVSDEDDELAALTIHAWATYEITTSEITEQLLALKGIMEADCEVVKEKIIKNKLKAPLCVMYTVFLLCIQYFIR